MDLYRINVGSCFCSATGLSHSERQDHGKLTLLTPGCCWVGVRLWEAVGHHSGSGEVLSVARDMARPGSGSPGLQGVLVVAAAASISGRPFTGD